MGDTVPELEIRLVQMGNEDEALVVGADGVELADVTGSVEEKNGAKQD